MGDTFHPVIELTAGGPADPNAARASVVLAAYFRVEQIRDFRRWLCPRLGLVAILWLAVAATAAWSHNTMFAGLLILGSGGAWTAVLEWHETKRLSGLLERR